MTDMTDYSPRAAFPHGAGGIQGAARSLALFWFERSLGAFALPQDRAWLRSKYPSTGICKDLARPSRLTNHGLKTRFPLPAGDGWRQIKSPQQGRHICSPG
jgi:hypothetical protein